MNPRKIFLFGLCFVAIVCAISAVFPPGGWEVGRWVFYFPNYRLWFQPATVEYKDIRNIISSVDTTGYETDTLLAGITPATADTAGMTEASSPQRATIPVDSVYTYTYPFEFPQGQDTLLYPFFRIAGNPEKRSKPVRIMHYGDSQIEGDRITSTIRNYMQQNYGGQGIGFIPVVPATDASVTFQQDVSPGWKRFSILDRKADSLVSDRRFGVAGNIARHVASGTADTVAGIGFKPFYFGFRNARSFTRARLFFGESDVPCTVVINQTDTQTLFTRQTVASTCWQFEKRQNSLHLRLQSQKFPDLYGIALDGAMGVAVDNISLRGGRGLEFSRMNAEQMKQMFRMMDVEMLILQFGANVVPSLNSNYNRYAHELTKQLRLLKSLKPALTVIVIGVGDMSQNNPDGYKSYPNITKVRDAQRQAAFDAGCVFWDLFETMGGENSMPSWVFAEPPLAQKDFVHFSHTGAKIIAELFCRAWEKEYRQFVTD